MAAIRPPAACRSAGAGIKTRPTNIPTDYTQFLDPNGLKGARIGITRAGLSGFDQRATPVPVTTPFEAAFRR